MQKNCLKEIDEFIYEIYKKIDILNYLTPINLEEENTIFLDKYSKGEEYNPIYQYKNINDDFDINLIINKIKYYKSQINDNLDILSKKFTLVLNELYNNICMCNNIEQSKVFTDYSKKIYGLPKDELIEKASNILKNNNYKEEDLIYNANTCKEVFEEQLKILCVDWTVNIKEPQSSKVNVISESKKININKNARFSDNDIKRLCAHEIGTHVLRAHNGSMQNYKIFSIGLSNYLTTEEGLATVNEEINNVLDIRTFRIYAGRVIAVNQSMNKSFYEVYKNLLTYFNENDALYITTRVKRGLKYTNQPGGFTKDYIYLDGYYKVKQYLKNKNIEDLYIGVIGIEDVEECKELIKEGILNIPKLIKY